MGWLGRTVDRMAHWLLKFRIFSAPARWIANSRPAWSVISRTDRVRTNRLRDRIKTGKLPEHVSIIMDGNRRFAFGQGVKTEIGHQHGKEKLKDVMDWVLELEIPYFTVYALSTENIQERDPEELDTLYDLYVAGFKELGEDVRIHKNKVRVQAVGRLEMLPERVRKAITEVQELTAKNEGFLFTVCLAYGGREEIVDAVRQVAAEHASGEMALDSITPETISERLYTADLPDPDLVIRTSGEERISNFLLWQIAYSELHFTDVHWPSFSRQDLFEAIYSYQKRKRRFGS